MFNNHLPLFITSALLAVSLLIFTLKDSRKSKFSLYSLSLCLILGGALGNLCDRVFLGYVVDFLDFRIWPVFNIADSAITVGAILLGLSVLKESKK
jgi:signal peptidase II